MLLSLYASLRWASEGVDKSCVLKVAALTLVLSFFSSLGTIWILFLGPLPLLSFPALSYYGGGSFGIHETYNIALLTLPVYSMKPPYSLNPLMVGFAIFVLINLLAALLGLWLGRLLRIEETKKKRRITSVAATLVGMGFVGAGLLLTDFALVFILYGIAWLFITLFLPFAARTINEYS